MQQYSDFIDFETRASNLPGAGRTDAATVCFFPGLVHEGEKNSCFLGAVAASGSVAPTIAEPAQDVHGVFQKADAPDTEAMMLAEVEQGCAHAPEDDLGFAVREFEGGELAAGFSADVGDNDIGPIEDLKALSLDAAAKVDLFGIEEESGVEQAGLHEGFAAHDGKGAGNPVDFRGEIVIGPGAIGRAEDA